MPLMWRSWHMAQEKGWQFDKGQTIYILVAWSCLTWTHNKLASKDCHPHAQKDLLSSVQGETFMALTPTLRAIPWNAPQLDNVHLIKKTEKMPCTLHFTSEAHPKRRVCSPLASTEMLPGQLHATEKGTFWQNTNRNRASRHLGISHLLSIFCFLLLWFPRSQNLLLPDLSTGSKRILNPRQKKWNGIISKDWGKKIPGKQQS